MKIPFCETIADPETGRDVLFDIEGYAEVSLDWDVWGDPLVSVDAVYVNGVDLFRSGLGAFKHLAAIIAEKIEGSDEVLSDLLEQEREAA